MTDRIRLGFASEAVIAKDVVELDPFLHTDSVMELGCVSPATVECTVKVDWNTYFDSFDENLEVGSIPDSVVVLLFQNS